MGASGWSYFVPYQSDIQNALLELQETVFQSGKYYRAEPYWRNMSFEETLPPGLTEEEVAEYRIEYESLQKLPEPTSIETLREWNAGEGTHSILDIKRINDTPDFGVVAPLSSEERINFFGTDQPTRTMIEDKEFQLTDFLQRELGRGRYVGTYLIIYRANTPDAIYFVGYSGD